MEPFLTFLIATRDVLLVGLVHPTAAVAAGFFWAGWVMGSSKNRTAFAEIGRGVISGVAAWGVVALAQLVILGASS